MNVFPIDSAFEVSVARRKYVSLERDRDHDVYDFHRASPRLVLIYRTYANITNMPPFLEKKSTLAQEARRSVAIMVHTISSSQPDPNIAGMDLGYFITMTSEKSTTKNCRHKKIK